MDKVTTQRFPVLSQRYFFVINRAMLIVGARLAEYCQKKAGIDLRSLWVLAAANESLLPQKSIADWLGINHNSMVDIVDELEKRGLLKRCRSNSDRRHSLLEITDKGKELVDTSYENFDDVTAKAFAPIPLKDVERFRKVCMSLVRDEYFSESRKIEE